MESILSKNLAFIDDSLVLLSCQSKRKGIRTDILCLDKDGRLIIIELKVFAESNAIDQVLRYEEILKCFPEYYSLEIQKCICCLRASDSAKSLALQKGILCKELDEKALLRTGSLKYHELDIKTQILISYLFSRKEAKDIKQISEEVGIPSRVVSRELSFLSLFIPFEITTDGEGNEKYRWPIDFSYEGIENFEDFIDFGLDKFTRYT